MARRRTRPRTTTSPDRVVAAGLIWDRHPDATDCPIGWELACRRGLSAPGRSTR